MVGAGAPSLASARMDIGLKSRARSARVLIATVAAAVMPEGGGAQSAQGAQSASVNVAVICASKSGERQTCAADTQSGVTLLRAVGDVSCVSGKTWGYDQRSIWVSDGCSAEFAVGRRKESFGTYTPLSGFKFVDTDKGDVSLKIYTYVRYLNQMGLDTYFDDSFTTRRVVDERQDIMLQKVNIQLLGWLLDPKFRYLAYTWTSNVSQGLGAQVVVAGNLTYNFNKHFSLAGGVGALPGVRATEGNFPLWLGVDNRLLADEFFRPSYTMGVWVEGKVVEKLKYMAMVGNNLSQLGVDAGQLDDDLNTWSTLLVWMPTTGEFGPRGGFGDFEHHDSLATRLGGHFTWSDENFQGTANTDAFENVQIRLSDGNSIFLPNLFGTDIRVTDARYQMLSSDVGFKYLGFSLEGEYYWRWVGNFRGPGTDVVNDQWDHGFQLQASAMAIPKRLQVYVSGSHVNGQYGNPSDFRVGVNWFPFKTQVVRWNTEYLHLNRSPVGGLSLPYVVGGNGPVVYSNFEVNF